MTKRSLATHCVLAANSYNHATPLVQIAPDCAVKLEYLRHPGVSGTIIGKRVMEGEGVPDGGVVCIVLSPAQHPVITADHCNLLSACRSRGLRTICVVGEGALSPDDKSLIKLMNGELLLVPGTLGLEKHCNLAVERLIRDFPGKSLVVRNADFAAELARLVASELAAELGSAGLRVGALVGPGDGGDLAELLLTKTAETLSASPLGKGAVRTVRSSVGTLTTQAAAGVVGEDAAAVRCRDLLCERGVACSISSAACVELAAVLTSGSDGGDDGASASLAPGECAVALLTESLQSFEQLQGVAEVADCLAGRAAATKKRKKGGSDDDDGEGLGDDKWRGAAIEDLNLPIPETVNENTSIAEAMTIMASRDFDNLPVVDGKKRLVGLVTRETIGQQEGGEGTGLQERAVSAVMYRFSRKHKYVPIHLDTPLADLERFFDTHSIAFVTDPNNWCLGVVTKMDLYTFQARRR